MPTPQTKATDYKSVKVSVVMALLTLSAAIERWEASELEELSSTMRAIASAYGKYRQAFDAKLKAEHDAGRVTLGDEKTGKGILPVRAFRDPDAAKPGRKAVVKTEAQILAELTGLEATDLK